MEWKRFCIVISIVSIIHKRYMFFHMVIPQKKAFFPCIFHRTTQTFGKICPFSIKTDRRLVNFLSKLPKRRRLFSLTVFAFFIYANNEPKSALVRDPGDCRDHSYFTAIASISRRTSFGSLATSTQERAGQSFAKYFA